MGKSLSEASKAAAAVFQRAEAARPGIQALCFEGPAEELNRTKNTQPCLWTVEMAAVEALKEAGLKTEDTVAAGFSLGEIAALTYAGAADFETGFQLVCRRAERMEEAAVQADAAMAAVLKLDAPTVEQLCEKFDQVWPVNYNCPGQIAVAGLKTQLVSFADAVKEAGGRARMLNVAGAFHSPMMQAAAEGFRPAVEAAQLQTPVIPLYSNYTGVPYEGSMTELLCKQICSPVRWQNIVEHMADQGVDTFVEVGPGRTLSGLIARTLPEVHTLQVSDRETLEHTLEELGLC
jgi:[acyl-carrier-protein] S-malonyltransferase